VGIDRLCGLLGKTRQGYYQKGNYTYREVVKGEIILEMVQEIRLEMPRIGVRKLLEILSPRLIGELTIGRDSFFTLLRNSGLLIRRRKTRVITTDSRHWMRKYPNIIKGMIPDEPYQLLVSDITFVTLVSNISVFLFLVTDAYSHKIVGWNLAQTLHAEHAVSAMKMVLVKKTKEDQGTIHHSDRGSQYCCEKYVSLLNKNGIDISMTETGDPRDNAIAERVNGILKTEWLNAIQLTSYQHAQIEVDRVIGIYNNKRPHSSIDMLTPNEAHKKTGNIPSRWKNYRKEAFLARQKEEQQKAQEKEE